MSIISTGSFAQDLLPGIAEWVGLDYNQHDALYKKMYETQMSSRNFEEETLASTMGLARKKNQGEATVYDSMSQGYTKRYQHNTYSNGFIITREMMEDGQSDLIAQLRSKALAYSMAQAKETVAAQVLNRAFDSNYTGGDAKELCATDHPTRSADVRNELTTAADLSEAALEQAIIDIADFRDDRGLRMKVLPKSLVIPTALSFEATRLTASDLRPATSDNDVNAIKNMSMLQGPTIVNPFLTDTDAWFILTTAPDGLKHYQRRPMEVTLDNDFDTENAKFKATERYSFSWTDFRGVFGSPGA